MLQRQKKSKPIDRFIPQNTPTNLREQIAGVDAHLRLLAFLLEIVDAPVKSKINAKIDRLLDVRVYLIGKR